MNLEHAIQNLEQWTDSLHISVKQTVPQIKRVFDDDYKLIAGCPSKASAALMNLRQIEKVMEELNAAMTFLEDVIREDG